MRTPHVWEEGDADKFFVSDGMAGVPKAPVRRIRTAPAVSHDRASLEAALPQGAGHPAAEDVPQPEDQRHTTTGDASADRAKKATLTRHLEEATTR